MYFQMCSHENMTEGRHRLRRISKWTGTILSTILLAAWLWSTIWTDGALVTLYVRGRAVVLFQGHLFWSLKPWPTPLATISYRKTGIGNPAWPVFCSTLTLSRPPVLFSWPNLWLMPMSAPFFVVAIPTSVLWYLERRRRIAPGHCPSCNYNLTGNTTGICPECDSASALEVPEN